MKRKLCEFYRDRGYPQNQATHCWVDGCAVMVQYAPIEAPVIPDIPGLLAFLNGKLCGPGSTVTTRLKFGELCRRWVNRIVDNALSMAELGDAVEMLAEDGKAALEALDEH